jgi:hypothetical protein
MGEKIEVVPFGDNSMIYVYTLREEINPNPPYQRQSDIWNLESKQLLIDSIINGFDIPKIYFHHHYPAQRGYEGGLYKYSIIDGKQRLSALWDFMDNKFPLSQEFRFLEDPDLELAGKFYKELSDVNTKLKLRFDGKPLPIYLVKVEDVELIDEMFSRLNEAAPLNAPEKRRAMGGPIPSVVDEISNHDFFIKKVSFSNKRFKHQDIAAKLLLLEHSGKITDTKKRHLDEFYRKPHSDNDTKELENSVHAINSTLDALKLIFEDKDKLLKNMGFVPQIYLLAKKRMQERGKVDFKRDDIMEFENIRKENREVAERSSNDDSAKDINYELIEYDRLSQSPNDASSIKFRVDLLEKYL